MCQYFVCYIQGSASLIFCSLYFLQYCICISSAIFIAVLATLIFRTLYFWLYKVLDKFIGTNWRFSTSNKKCWIFFSTKKMLLEQSLKCKLYLKNWIKLVNKNKFAAARVKIFVITRIFGMRSIFHFGLPLSEHFLKWKLK